MSLKKSHAKHPTPAGEVSSDFAAAHRLHCTVNDREILGPVASADRHLGEKDPIPCQEQPRTPEKFECESPAVFSLSFTAQRRTTRRPTPSRLHPPSNDNPLPRKHRQHAWCLRPRCRGRQVHQRLRRLLEASGQAANPRSVSTSTQIEKRKKRWTKETIWP